jgi:ubiquinone/menaquinone biosynthesis C-methylase UbiE
MRDPYKDNPSTYVVMDRSNKEEMARLHIQDQMLTANMGGALPEQADPTRFQSVLDVGCGTGDWLIEAAKSYPTMSRLVGVDISERMIKYAREQAEVQGVSDRVSFSVKDVLRPRDFPPLDASLTFDLRDNSFDLVNQRLGLSWLRIWDWKEVLWAYQRVCKMGGVIRITEWEIISETSSPALNRLFQLMLDAFERSGHLFTPNPDGVTSRLAYLLNQYAGILERNILTRAYKIEYRVGTPEWQNFYDDVRHGFRTHVHFFRKWARVPADYEKVYQRALNEMQQSDFVAIAHLLTAWGTKTIRMYE